MASMSEGSAGEFEWDAANLRHLARHRITREEFEEAMAHDPIVVHFRDESGEKRWYALGATEHLRVLFLVLTYRGDRIRPITGWDAGKELREAYYRRRFE
jgi:uncharacterized DUF497 family protein